jgi:hypothetical protein
LKRSEIIAGLKNYFAAHEVVDKQTYNKFRDESWQFFDTETLHTLLVLREGIDKPFDINNWFWGGSYDERGLRTNLSDIVKGKNRKNILYLSGHVLGKAFDFKVRGMDSEDVRNWIVAHSDEMPCKIRLEHHLNGKPISWVHFDTKWETKNPHVYLFDI